MRRSLAALASTTAAMSVARSPPALVTFDFTGTLCDPKTSVGRAYKDCIIEVASSAALHERALLTTTVTSLDEAALSRAFGAAYRAADESKPCFGYGERGGSREWWLEVVSATLSNGGLKSDVLEFVLPAAFERLYSRVYASAEGWQVKPHSAECLQMLNEWREAQRREGGPGGDLKIGVLSNWDDRLPALLTDCALAQYVDVVVTSGAAGVEKPSVEIYDYVRRMAGVRAGARAVHCGDSFSRDIVGATDAGWEAVFVCPPERIGKLDEATRAAMRTTPHILIEDLSGFGSSVLRFDC